MRLADEVFGPVLDKHRGAVSHEELEAAVRCVEKAQREDPLVTPWAIFTHLDGRCHCGGR